MLNACSLGSQFVVFCFASGSVVASVLRSETPRRLSRYSHITTINRTRTPIRRDIYPATRLTPKAPGQFGVGASLTRVGNFSSLVVARRTTIRWLTENTSASGAIKNCAVSRFTAARVFAGIAPLLARPTLPLFSVAKSQISTRLPTIHSAHGYLDCWRAGRDSNP
jgi:hypothetical protein